MESSQQRSDTALEVLTGTVTDSIRRGTDDGGKIPSTAKENTDTEASSGLNLATEGTENENIGTQQVYVDVESNPFLKAFQVALIADRIMHFISFEDIKTVSVLSKTTQEIVKGNRLFLSRAIQRIVPELLSNGPGVLSVRWKHLVVDLAILEYQKVDEQQEKQRRKLVRSFFKEMGVAFGSAESLYLHIRPENYHHNYTQNSSGECSALTNNIRYFLQKTRKLRTLKIDEELLFDIPPYLWKDEEVSRTLRYLNRIEICAYKTWPSSHSPGLEKWQKDERFWENVHEISSAAKKLTAFSLKRNAPMIWKDSGRHCLRFVTENRIKLDCMQLGKIVVREPSTEFNQISNDVQGLLFDVFEQWRLWYTYAVGMDVDTRNFYFQLKVAEWSTLD